MEWLFWFGVIKAFISLLIGYTSLAESAVAGINKQEVNVGAQYVAEASINKQLYSIKSEDVYAAEGFATKLSGGKTKDMRYGFVNEGADSGYFDARFVNAPADAIDLGDIPGGDITFKEVLSEDSFNAFVLDYNKSVSEKIAVIVVRYPKGGNAGRCDFGDYEGASGCPELAKFVVNTADPSQNGALWNGYQAFFRAGSDGYSDRVYLTGFAPAFYNYRVTFGTLSWRDTNFSYHVELNGAAKRVTNNVVEIDTIGTAIDNFARMKIQKRISDQIAPLSKYVLFSDGEIAK